VSDLEPERSREEQDEPSPNPSADEFFDRIKHDFRRPKPSEESVASAVQAIQKLTGEAAVEQAPTTFSLDVDERCPKCSASNSGMNRFCGYCGAAMVRPEKSRARSQPNPSEKRHIYHHHYHHHYFSEEDKHSGNSPDILGSPGTSVGGDKTESAPPSDQVEADADVEKSIQILVRNWSVCFNSKRLDDLMGLYSSDAIVLRPNSASAHGQTAIRNLFQLAVDAGFGDVELDCVDIGMVGDFACLTGRSKMLVPTAPAKRHEESGKYLLVARREGGEWKIVADSWCMDAPKAPSASATAPVLPMRQRKQS